MSRKQSVAGAWALAVLATAGVAQAQEPAPQPTPAPTTPENKAPSQAPPPQLPGAGPPIVGGSLGKRYTSWDANIEGAYGRILSDPTHPSGFGRVRGGVLWIRDPHFLSLGVTYEFSDRSAATLGIQGEYLNLELGVWAQAGPLVDLAHAARPGGMFALGWSVLGVELQARSYEDLGFAPAVYAKLRIPLGIIGFGVRGR
jgi:hypothetical protein